MTKSIWAALSSTLGVSAQLANLTAPALPDTPGTVPICPHEWLTSTRVAFIAGLPGLKPIKQLAERKEIDALASTASAHHGLLYYERVATSVSLNR